MGSQKLRSKPTVHNDSLNNKYKDCQQRKPASRTPSKASDEVSDITCPVNQPRSPISPLDSHSETWRHPPRARAQPKGKEPIYNNGAPEGHFRLRPFSFYEELYTSPEPDDKSVFADMLAAPPKKRLSRPFEQPYPTYNHGATLEKEKTASGPTQANPPRGESRHRRQPAQFSSNRKGNRKAPPTPIVIPPPVHQANVRRKPAPDQESQSRPQRPARQETQGRAQKPAHHHGWNPLAEPPRQQRGAQTQHKEQRRNNKFRNDDLEWQGELLRSKNRSKHDDPQYKSGRRCFFFLVLMLILVIVVIVVIVERNLHQR